MNGNKCVGYGGYKEEAEFFGEKKKGEIGGCCNVTNELGIKYL